MFIFAIFPYLNFFIYYILSYLFRALDAGPLYFMKKGNEQKTKFSSIQAFVETYAGPEFDLYYRYPQLINTVWVIFTYGVALPILYPVGLVCMVNTYISERIQLAYYFRQPPLYDNRLTLATVKSLQIAPIIMTCMGYWFLGNR